MNQSPARTRQSRPVNRLAIGTRRSSSASGAQMEVLESLRGAVSVHALILDPAGRVVAEHTPVALRDYDTRRTQGRLIGRMFLEVCDQVTACAGVHREVAAGVHRVLAGRELTCTIEFQVHGALRDGWRELHACRLAGDTAGTIVIVRDVTARCDTAAALELLRERYRLATSAGQVGVWDLNLATREIFIDPALKALIGYLDGEIIGRLDEWHRHVHPDDIAMIKTKLEEHLDGRTPVYEVEHRKLHRDGSVRWFRTRGMVIEWSGGRPARVVGTDVDITAVKQSDEALRQIRAANRRQKRQKRRLAIQLMLAQQAERRRIGQELHDDICQRIAALEIIVGDALRRSGTAATGTLDEVHSRLSQLAFDVRQLSHGMNPPDVGAGQLVMRLRAHVEELSRSGQLNVRLKVRDLPPDMPTDVALCLHRIVQESLHNVTQHAETRTADVELREDAEGVRLEIVDGGRGFDSSQLKATGVGLTGMKKRIRRLCGRFDIVSSPGSGTRIIAWLPIVQS